MYGSENRNLPEQTQRHVRYHDTAAIKHTPLDQLTILLVDDDQTLRSLAASYLSNKGFHVISCNGAALAGEVVKSRARIDLLITDVDMPERTGTELSIEMNELRPAVPVLLISGGCQTEQNRTQARQRGWDQLSKPFRLPELLRSVHVLLERSPQA